MPSLFSILPLSYSLIRGITLRWKSQSTGHTIIRPMVMYCNYDVPILRQMIKISCIFWLNSIKILLIIECDISNLILFINPVTAIFLLKPTGLKSHKYFRSVHKSVHIICIRSIPRAAAVMPKILSTAYHLTDDASTANSRMLYIVGLRFCVKRTSEIEP
jgi:hypothetical protein